MEVMLAVLAYHLCSVSARMLNGPGTQTPANAAFSFTLTLTQGRRRRDNPGIGSSLRLLFNLNPIKKVETVAPAWSKMHGPPFQNLDIVLSPLI